MKDFKKGMIIRYGAYLEKERKRFLILRRLGEAFVTCRSPCKKHIRENFLCLNLDSGVIETKSLAPCEDEFIA